MGGWACRHGGGARSRLPHQISHLRMRMRPGRPGILVLVEREGPAPYQNLPRGPVVPARHPDSPEPSLLYPIGWGVPGGSPRLFLLDLLQTTCQPETFPLLLVSVQGDSTLHVPRLRTGKLLDFEEGVVEYADAL
jgi:hypothetical protein